MSSLLGLFQSNLPVAFDKAEEASKPRTVPAIKRVGKKYLSSPYIPFLIKWGMGIRYRPDSGGRTQCNIQVYTTRSVQVAEQLLKKRKPLSATDAAKKLGRSRHNFAKIFRAMEEEGLVVTEFQNRCLCATITPKGKLFYKELKAWNETLHT